MPDDGFEKQLIELRRKRGIVKGSLTRIKNFTTAFDLSIQPISLLEFRQEELPRLNRKFDDVQTQIEMISEEPDKEEAERDFFESEYFHVRSQIQELVNSQKASSTVGHNASFGTASINHSVRLAPIPLPTFNGNIQDWESFIDLFRALVHNDDTISAAQKHLYLRSTLSGPALELVSSVPMTEANYEVILRRLEQRYDNKSLVIQSHIKAILDTPKITEPSAKELQKLHSHVGTHVSALSALSQPVESWDAWLITIITSCLDTGTNHEWQLRQTNTNLPKYRELEKFLESRCVAFESSEASSRSVADTTFVNKPSNKKSNFNSKRALVAFGEPTPCQCCAAPHKLYNCEKFKDLSINARVALAHEKRICFNCLSPGHMSSVCKSTYSCRTCKRKHHSLLHFEKSLETTKNAQQNNHNAAENLMPSTSGVSVAASVPNESKGGYVFLATALVNVQDKNGVQRKCRAILDSGSQINFVSRSFAKLLQLSSKRSSLPISGIGNKQLLATSCIELQIQSRVNSFSTIISCYTLPNIVGDVAPCAKPENGWQIPNELVPLLADPLFHNPQTIDLLIGGGTFFDILRAERKPLGIGSVCLQESHFGWLVTGELPVTHSVSFMSMGQTTEEDWKALNVLQDENYGQQSKANQKCVEEQETLQHFRQNTKRDEEGRFVVCLPKKTNLNELGTTLSMATSRFLNVERRLQHDDYLKNEYTHFMDEYIQLGHMQEVVEDISPMYLPFYLPHHAVVKSSSLTTKVRVVFDASAKSSSGLSLNDVLKCGPTIQQDLFSILTRFRKHQFVITSDVEKMFRQVKVAKEDWNLQRIVWRSNPKDKLRSYYLTTVTYGTTPASFLATYCLMTLAEEVKHQFTRASKAIRDDFYMDDLMTGADTEEECCQLQRDVNSILDSAKLPLRKWCSNSLSILQTISKRVDDPLFTLDIGDDDTVKSLGLQWKPIADQFQFIISPRATKGQLTKRMILSDLNRIFDPLGFLSPVLIKGKIFLQQMWAMKIDWDAKLPIDIQDKWCRFYEELDQLKTLSIPRKAEPKQSNIVEMHGFCDASEEAYGACVYVRSQDTDGRWHSRLLCSKTRVAPLKGMTIPRLELNGALLLAELAKKVSGSWEIKAQCFRLWTDSSIVLGWLNSQNSRLKTFVANRIAQILDLTEVSQWNHIITSQNPADIPSRGLRPSELLSADLWWYGPEWMINEEISWPKQSPQSIQENQLPEQRPLRITLIALEPSKDLINKYSDWKKLVRATAWFKRFIEYLRSKRTITFSRFLTVQELIEAERIIIKRAQQEAFGKDIAALKRGEEVSRKSSLKSLCPFLDDGIILVGGRLQNANIPKEQQNPIVLSPDNKITRLIFIDCHKRMLHCGPQLLLAEVRRIYWPIRGRVMARSVTRKCIICKRANPTFTKPIMAALPKQRVQFSRPFTVTGVDFAGPLIIRSGVRGKAGKKSWISIFVCFSTRAVHIEAVEDLTSGAFIAAFRRFVSRRGKPNQVWSDNGTNFVGAQKELASYISNIEEGTAREGISWNFNPPGAPHFGGLWESAVKSAKFHTTRITRGVTLTLGELETLLCQIEACLNCRPLTPMSSDPNDFEPITPAHFLIGGPMMFHAEPVLDEAELTRVKRWKLVQCLLQSFWKRWHAEYLPQLQIRGKWTAKTTPLGIHDIVIVKEDNSPPTKWKLARVIEVHPGKDGVVRVATIRMPNGSETRRPAVKLCRLPIEDCSSVENLDFQRGENV